MTPAWDGFCPNCKRGADAIAGKVWCDCPWHEPADEERVEVDAVVGRYTDGRPDLLVDSDDLADAGFRPGDRVRVTLVGPKTK